MINHKADCKCPPCRYRRAAQGPKEILSIRLDAATKKKLNELEDLYKKGRAVIVAEAIDTLHSICN